MANCADWDSYLWEPGGSVLRNRYGERDGEALAALEYAETNKQQTKIELGLVEIPRTYDAQQLRAIHKQLFENVYEWAGEYRTVGMAKNGMPFAHPNDIPRYLADAGRIVHGADWARMDRDQFAAAAASTFAYINQGHPFREGNGRVSKLFMQQVSELSRFRLDYSPERSGVTAEMWNQASMLSGPDMGSYRPVPDSLVPVFRALAVERSGAAPVTSLDAARERTREAPGTYRPRQGPAGRDTPEAGRGTGRAE